MRQLLAPLLAAALVPSAILAGQQPAPAAPAPSSDTTFYAVAYVEASAVNTRETLKTYRDACRTLDGCVRVELFEQIGRPLHFAVFETWRDQPTFEARDPAVQQGLITGLQPYRTSGYDQRPYKTLTVGKGPGALTKASVIVIAHVDVTQSPAVPPILRRLADASRLEPGNLRFDIVQHMMRANHFTVIEAWRDQRALDAHAAAAHTRQYRDEIQPLTGSPLDERVYTTIP